jgi:hypothetical protein
METSSLLGFAFGAFFTYNINIMSKFAEKLERVYRGTAPPIGFHKSTEAEISPLLFMATLTKTGAADASALAGAGIDAGIIGGKSLSAKSSGELTKAIGDVPLGFFLDSTEKDVIAKSLDLGCDFIVFGLKTPLEAVNREGLGRVLRIEPSMEPGLVRAVNSLPLEIDAVLIAGDDPARTFSYISAFYRVTEQTAAGKFKRHDNHRRAKCFIQSRHQWTDASRRCHGRGVRRLKGICCRSIAYIETQSRYGGHTSPCKRRA